jgi:hypothetical protein
MVMQHGKIVLTNDIVVALFRHQLFVRSVGLFVALGMVFLLALVLSGRIRSFNLGPQGIGEARARTLLRFGFGLLWVIDGILQFQPAMPLGLGNDVIAPAADGTPTWLHALMNEGVSLWNAHPLTLAVGAAWIQVGIGLLLIVSNGRLGRLAAVVSVGWAGLIWIIGNGAGGIFSPSGSLLFGWPGATLFYVVAGVWLALTPEQFAQRFSTFTLRFLSVVVLLGALRQCLPSVGFWHGGNVNALTQMTRDMTQVAQPSLLSSLVLHGGTLAGTLGGGFNLLLVMWLTVTGVGLWLAPQRRWRWPTWSLVVFSVVFWFIAQDTALFGGLATDVNSLPPFGLLAGVASPAVAMRSPVARRLPKELRSLTAGVVASFAAAMIVFAVGSMTWATTQGAETTFFVASNGLASAVDNKAPGFSLIDQHGHPFTLASTRGHYTVLTFLDPVCTTDCSLMAEQLKAVRRSLPATAPISIVAVAANPLHERLSDVRHFVAQHQLNAVPGFSFVTGSPATLRAVWNSYGISVLPGTKDAMSIHADYLFVIDPRGHLRWIMPDDPLNGASALMTSDEAEVLQLLHNTGLH